MADDLKDPAPEGQDNPEEQRPDWLPENFKEPEALVESYKEAQRKITELTGQVKSRDENLQSFSERLEQIEAQSHQQQQQSQQYDLVAAYEQAYEQGDVRSMLQIQAQIADATYQARAAQAPPAQPAGNESQSEIVARFAEDGARAKFQDWDTVRTKVADVLRARPGLLSDDALSSPSKMQAAFEDAYRIVKFDEIQSGASPADQAAELQRQMKLQAQTAQGASGRPGSPDAEKESWDRIKNAAKTEPGQYW